MHSRDSIMITIRSFCRQHAQCPQSDHTVGYFHQKYIICENKNYDTGINWDEKIVHTNKMNSQSTHSYYWSFNSIKNVANNDTGKFRTVFSMFENKYTPFRLKEIEFTKVNDLPE